MRLTDGTWSARTYVRDLDGERRLVARRGRSGAAAERALRQALTERIVPARGAVGPETRIRDVAERWFAGVQADVEAGERSPNTARLYRHYLDRHILPGVGALRLREATVARLDEFVAAVHGRSGTAAANACRSALSGVLGLAVRHGAMSTNPVGDIRRIRGVGGRVKARSLTVDECARWLARLETDPVAVRRDLPDLTRWFLATGVRIGEAIAVGWDTIDLNRALVEIDHKVLRVKGQGLLRVPRTKSDAGHRTLPLRLFAMRMLERRQAEGDAALPRFPDALGGWRDPSNVSRDLRDARGSDEFAWVTSHVFRKTAATELPSLTQDLYMSRRAVTSAAADALDPGTPGDPWGQPRPSFGR